MRQLLLYLLLFLLASGCIALGIIQNNPKFKQQTIDFITTTLDQELGLKIKIDSCSINLFKGKATFYNITIYDKFIKNCSGRCKQATVHIGKLAFLFLKQINLYLEFNKSLLKTGMDKLDFETVDAIKVFNRINSGTKAGPVNVQTVTFHNFELQLEPSYKLHTKIQGSLYVTYNSKRTSWQLDTNIIKGITKLNGNTLLTQMSGNFHWHQDAIYTFANNFTADINYKITPLKKSHSNTYHSAFRYNHHQKTLDITCPQEQSKIILTFDKLNKLTGIFPLAHASTIYKFLYPQSPEQRATKSQPLQVVGLCKTELTLWSDPLKTKGKLWIKNLQVNSAQCGDWKFKITSNHKKLITKFYCNNNIIPVRGTAKFNTDDKNIGYATITNTQPCTLFRKNTLRVNPGDLTIVCTLDKQSAIHATYNLSVLDTLIQTKLHCAGSATFSYPELALNGTTPEGHFNLNLNLMPTLHIKNFAYTSNGKKNVILKAHPKNPRYLIGKMRYSFLRELMPFDLKRALLGKQGLLTIQLNQQNYNDISGTLRLLKGRLYLAGSYNLITGLHFAFNLNYPEQALHIRDFTLTCFKGTITSPAITYLWNADNNLEFIHAPFCCHDLLINWKKDFYSFICGNMLFEKQPNKRPKLISDFILQRSLLHENIFSSGTHSALLSSTFAPCVSGNEALDVELNIMSEELVAAKTPFLQTSATLDLCLKSSYANGVMQTPEIMGTIKLDGGYLQFLRHKLMITYGSIDFMPYRINDPSINLQAKNRIKKYLITLTANGSLQKPQILLESVPELTEEQILALLLAGSERASLQADLPAILMQNLNTLLFSNKELLGKTNSFFKKISKPFQYVQITPHFADQSGRGGGIKGTVAIDITPQLHAQIQKDFLLQEDLSFQVEYFLTDDFNVKAIRESSGDVKAEAEVRLKF